VNIQIAAVSEALGTSIARREYLLDIVKDAEKIDDKVSANIYNELAELHGLYRTLAEAVLELQNEHNQHHGRLGGS